MRKLTKKEMKFLNSVPEDELEMRFACLVYIKAQRRKLSVVEKLNMEKGFVAGYKLAKLGGIYEAFSSKA